MRLNEVSVSNYRSIAKQTRFTVGDLTTLIGPNNQGKSNLLRALSLGMTLIEGWSALPDRLAGKEELTGMEAVSFLRNSRTTRTRRSDDELPGYQWVRDYPSRSRNQRGRSQRRFDSHSHSTNQRLRVIRRSLEYATMAAYPLS
ncbi:AAA family ATPase [Plantibacter sp. M259]|uniref:AAA family ATPase n=1 Tax=Plantibacter sp. M259 TaxID=2583822 RepID=UPI001110EFFC